MNSGRLISLVIGLVVVILALVLVVWGLGALSDDDTQEGLQNDGFGIASFEECEAAGYPVMESYPRQCQAPDGTIFVEDGGVQPGSDSNEPSSGSPGTDAGASGSFQTSAGPISLTYQGGTLRLEASLQRNDACVNWKVERGNTTSGIRLNVISERTGEMCAQVISTQQLNTVVQANPSTTITLVFENDMVLFHGAVSQL